MLRGEYVKNHQMFEKRREQKRPPADADSLSIPSLINLLFLQELLTATDYEALVGSVDLDTLEVEGLGVLGVGSERADRRRLCRRLEDRSYDDIGRRHDEGSSLLGDLTLGVLTPCQLIYASNLDSVDCEALILSEPNRHLVALVSLSVDSSRTTDSLSIRNLERSSIDTSNVESDDEAELDALVSEREFAYALTEVEHTNVWVRCIRRVHVDNVVNLSVDCVAINFIPIGGASCAIDLAIESSALCYDTVWHLKRIACTIGK